MLPILISVSVAPTSYFFCASAPLVDAASKARAAEAMVKRVMAKRVANIKFLPVVSMRCVAAFLAKALVTWAESIPFYPCRHNKKPLRQNRRGCFFNG